MSHALYQLLFPNGKRYIGISSAVQRRWSVHRQLSRDGAKLPVHRAINAVGWEKVEKAVLAIGDKGYIVELEPRAIEAFNCRIPNGYNCSAGGESGPGPEASLKQAATLRASGKMSGIAKALWSDPEIRARRIAAGSATAVREAKGFWKRGTKETNATRERKSLALIGRPKSEQHRINSGLAKRGTVYITNGATNRRLRPPVELPQGWRFGMTKAIGTI